MWFNFSWDKRWPWSCLWVRCWWNWNKSIENKTNHWGRSETPKNFKRYVRSTYNQIKQRIWTSQDVWYQHSGLSMIIFAADRPTQYITRIKKVEKLSVSSDETMFKDSVLPLIVTTWMLKQNILKTRQIVANYRNKKRDKRDSSWLQTCWKE